jgi:hypothetical protein
MAISLVKMQLSHSLNDANLIAVPST